MSTTLDLYHASLTGVSITLSEKAPCTNILPHGKIYHAS